jgi:transcriptional regulator with XRE-family HTH domain
MASKVKFKERLKAWREENNLSLDDVGLLANRSVSNIAELEKGNKFTEKNKLLAEAMEMGVEEVKSYLKLIRDIKQGKFNLDAETEIEIEEAIKFWKAYRKQQWILAGAEKRRERAARKKK